MNGHRYHLLEGRESLGERKAFDLQSGFVVLLALQDDQEGEWLGELEKPPESRFCD